MNVFCISGWAVHYRRKPVNSASSTSTVNKWRTALESKIFFIYRWWSVIAQLASIACNLLQLLNLCWSHYTHCHFSVGIFHGFNYTWGFLAQAQEDEALFLNPTYNKKSSMSTTLMSLSKHNCLIKLVVTAVNEKIAIHTVTQELSAWVLLQERAMSTNWGFTLHVYQACRT